MKITADEEKLFVGDYKGQLKLISLMDGEVIKDYGQVHEKQITGIMITADQKFFFTSSYSGVLRQWNYKKNFAVRWHGEITNSIASLCI
jgi:WD40 repeat protein